MTTRTEARVLRFLNPSVVFTPSPRKDVKEVLVVGSEVVRVSEEETSWVGDGDHDQELVKTIDLRGQFFITPGLVDIHQHVTGGGGEDGYRSRVPSAKLSELIVAGITTFVGVLGTDTVTRSPQDLIAKVRGLSEEGLNGYMWTGGYTVPPPVLTGSVKNDIMFVPEVIGVGEVAISDHRSSNPSLDELKQLAAEARVAGLCTNKCGITYFHMGSDRHGIEPLFDMVNQCAIPVANLLPTHMDRTKELLEQGLMWIKLKGGHIDLSGPAESVTKAIRRLFRESESENSIKYISNTSVSSDAYGSYPVFDDQGVLVSYDYGRPSVLLDILHQVAKDSDELEHVGKCLQMFTENPATVCKLKGKGQVKPGCDADLLVFRNNAGHCPSLETLEMVMSGGVFLKDGDYVKKDMFGN